MNILFIILLVCGAFLCGAIPTGYLLVKYLKHIDVRQIGSGNIGSTNVKRAAGRGISLLTQLGDVLKGLVPVAIAMVVVPHLDLSIDDDIVTSLTALAAIAGHDVTPFLRFRGGKGVNTTLGAFLLIAPIPIIIALAVFILSRFITSIVSIRSLVSSLTVPMTAVLFCYPTVIVLASSAAVGLIILRHIDNIKRIITGTES